MNPFRPTLCVHCGRPEINARGLCHRCYDRVRRSGMLLDYPLGRWRYAPEVPTGTVWRWYCEDCKQWSFATFTTQSEAQECLRDHEIDACAISIALKNRITEARSVAAGKR